MAVLALAVALALAPVAHAGRIQQFQTPSGIVRCMYATDPTPFLRCDSRRAFKPKPPAPPATLHCREAGIDWSDSFWLRPRGSASAFCHGDTVFAASPAPVLAYGRSWSQAGIVCRSLRTGLRCTNASGRGFELAPPRWRLF